MILEVFCQDCLEVLGLCRTRLQGPIRLLAGPLKQTANGQNDFGINPYDFGLQGLSTGRQFRRLFQFGLTAGQAIK